MKVVLTAFQGKLRSEVMDWPEGHHGSIRMRMDLERPSWSASQQIDPTFMVTEYACVFEETGYYIPVPGDARGAKEFRLVGLR